MIFVIGLWTFEPSPRGRIIAIPQVGGLHHRYQRVA
jgi:hypothetical protein